MPPRSYYNDPRVSDYVAFASAYFPSEINAAIEFSEKTGLPYVNSSQHIAAYLGVSPSLIRQIIHRPSFHYREFPLVKADGSERKISTPKSYLKVVQWWILDNILRPRSLLPCVHGFRGGFSYVTNAKSHSASRHILNIDIKSFFDSISGAQIMNVFSSFGYSESGSFTLASLTTKSDIAPTGAPTSPMLANMIFRETDAALLAYSTEKGLVYTRYADDLTFSCQDRISYEVLDDVTKIVRNAGFNLNPNKTKFMGPGDRKEVTGVVVNSELSAPKEWRNSARGYLNHVQRNVKDCAGEIGKVRGIYGILKQFDPEHTKPLTRAARETLELLKQGRASTVTK